VLLSSNISPQQLLADFVSSSLSQAHHVYCIARFDNDTILIHTEKGEFTDSLPTSLAHFLTTSNTGWYSINETPFSKKHEIGQTLLEMELERDHLLLRNIKMDNCTLFLLVQLKPYGLSKDKYLLTVEKTQFERTIRGFIDGLLYLRSNDKHILKDIAKSNQMAAVEITETKKQLSIQSQNYEIAISQFIQLIVNKLQDKYEIEIHMSREFVDELKEYRLPFDQLEPNLERHVQIELNLALIQGERELVLTPAHLASFTNSYKSVVYANEDEMQLGRYAKTYKLLDRYEASANFAQEKGLSVIGKNIGNHCSPPVSNASITDALNKHAKKIFELFSKYPDRWDTIRHNFRSVANVIEKETERRREIA
jgi:predicted nucleic acid-binding protein